MNRGVLQSSPVQQLMAAGSPNWWNINNMRPPPSQHSPPLLPPPYNNHFTQYAPPPPSSSWLHNNSQEVLPESWSQLLMGGQVVEDVDKLGLSHIGQHDQVKKLENWEEELLHQQVLQQAAASVDHSLHDDDIVKQENSSHTTYNHHHHHVFGSSSTAEFQSASKPTWPQMMPLSSPKSCVSSNMLDFSNTNTSTGTRDHLSDRASECNSTATGGGAAKKARVQTSSSTQATFKVRKEKLGDRITALHQLVSPFGKTDTASVLLEAIGYIRFLQSQIEALSLPYLGSGSGNNMRQHQSVQGERNCFFPEDPGQLVNDSNCLKRKTTPDQETNAIEMKDLKSRGLCLVPISCTAQVESDNGADYWGPAAALSAGCFH